jgi:hypothetical protein
MKAALPLLLMTVLVVLFWMQWLWWPLYVVVLSEHGVLLLRL